MERKYLNGHNARPGRPCGVCVGIENPNKTQRFSLYPFKPKKGYPQHTQLWGHPEDFFAGQSKEAKKHALRKVVAKVNHNPNSVKLCQPSGREASELLTPDFDPPRVKIHEPSNMGVAPN